MTAVVTHSRLIERHASAMLEQLRVPQLLVFEGDVDGDPDMYVNVFHDTGVYDAHDLLEHQVDVEITFTIHSVGRDRWQAVWASDKVRDRLLGRVLEIPGRTCWRIQAAGSRPVAKDTTVTPVRFLAVDRFTLRSTPAAAQPSAPAPLERITFVQPYGRFELTRDGDTVHVHIDRDRLHQALTSGRGIRTPWFPALSGIHTFPFPGGGQATLNGSAIVVTASAPDDSRSLDFDYETDADPTDFSDTHVVLPISATANAGAVTCDRDGDQVTLTIDNSGATASVGTGSPWGLPWPASEPLDAAPRAMPQRGTVVLANTIGEPDWGTTFGGFAGMTPFPVPDGNRLVVAYTSREA